MSAGKGVSRRVHEFILRSRLILSRMESNSIYDAKLIKIAEDPNKSKEK